MPCFNRGRSPVLHLDDSGCPGAPPLLAPHGPICFELMDQLIPVEHGMARQLSSMSYTSSPSYHIGGDSSTDIEDSPCLVASFFVLHEALNPCVFLSKSGMLPGCLGGQYLSCRTLTGTYHGSFPWHLPLGPQHQVVGHMMAEACEARLCGATE